MRVEQKGPARGSMGWTQRLVNVRPDLVEDELTSRLRVDSPVEWLSPLEEDDFAEYRDKPALELLRLDKLEHPLSDFWPNRGPQWDALARAGDAVVLVEAKAHIPELFSGGSQAKAGRSRSLIQNALQSTKAWLGAKPGMDWAQRFYQYTNRLAHLYFLRELNGLDAHLMFLYFVGDQEMRGPEDRKQWQVATEVLHEALGIRGRTIPGLHHLYLDVKNLGP